MKLEVSELELGFLRTALLELIKNRYFMGDSFIEFDRKYGEIKPLIEKIQKVDVERDKEPF